MVKIRNLAQKWRTKTFGHIVGQTLSVRMLQNSLYVDRIFPVYLFAGQRGCGKTSTARIFASALNCAALSAFQSDPTHALPCLSCHSCTAMARQEHPDFIEIDAASHTGVDNVRDIIEASSLLPVLGRIRIYLIDEAHMLSKAAFNAFLKILEEPPASVVFILATTDPQKVLDTVRSRCFQVFFNPIAVPVLVDHLKQVCAHEAIVYDEDALTRIAHEAQGCVRDALTLVEQVWYACKQVTLADVNQLLGISHEDRVIELLAAVVRADMPQVAQWLNSYEHSYDVMQLVDSLAHTVRALLLHALGVTVSHRRAHNQLFLELVSTASRDRLVHIMQQLGEAELVLLKAINKRVLFEALLFKLCTSQISSTAPASPAGTLVKTVPPVASPPKKPVPSVPSREAVAPVPAPVEPVVREVHAHEQAWHQFVQRVEQTVGQLLHSVFKQGRCVRYNHEQGMLDVVLPDSLLLFKDVIEKHRKIWTQLLHAAFERPIELMLIYEASSTPSSPAPKLAPVRQSAADRSPAAVPVSVNRMVKGVRKERTLAAPIIDVSDVSRWQKTALVLEFFPGNVTKLGEQES